MRSSRVNIGFFCLFFFLFFFLLFVCLFFFAGDEFGKASPAISTHVYCLQDAGAVSVTRVTSPPLLSVLFRETCSPRDKFADDQLCHFVFELQNATTKKPVSSVSPINFKNKALY